MPDKINTISAAVKQDPILSIVYHLTLNSWPDRINEIPRISRQFLGATDELFIEEGILLKGDCVCIPPKLYDRSLNELHDMHLGIKKMQHRTRATLYWPGMDMDTAEYIKCCKTCTQHKATQHTQPMIPMMCDLPYLL